MNGRCKKIQIVLAESGPSALRDDASAQQHLVDCGDCYAVLTALSELDAALPGLPVHDVSDARVDALLARVRGLPLPKPDAPSGFEGFDQRMRAAARRSGEWYARFVASPAAVATLSAAAVAVVVLMVNLETSVVDMMAPAPSESQWALDESAAVRKDAGRFRSESEIELKKRNVPAHQMLAQREILAPDLNLDIELKKQNVPARQMLARREIPAPALNLMEADPLRALGYLVGSDESGALKRSSVEKRKAASAREITGGAYRRSGVSETPKTPEIPKLDIEEIVVNADKTSSHRDVPVAVMRFGSADLKELRIQGISDRSDFAPPDEFEAERDADEVVSRKREYLPPAPPRSRSVGDQLKSIKHALADNRAVDSLDRDARLVGLRFQPASGYWSNAYVPGDPAVRLLESRLNAVDREMLQASTSTRLWLHDRARQVQPSTRLPAPRWRSSCTAIEARSKVESA